LEAQLTGNVLLRNKSLSLLLLTAIEFHSVALVLTLVQTKQIRINTHKRNNTENTAHTTQNTVNTSVRISKTPKHSKTHTYTHPHITKQVKTTTVQVKTNTVHTTLNTVNTSLRITKTPTLYKTS